MEPTPVANPYLAEPVQTARVAAILAATMDAAPLELVCPGFESVRFYITYTADLAGGAVTFQIQISPYFEDHATLESWFAESDVVLNVPVLAGGADSTNLIQRQTHTYAEADVALSAQNFEYTFPLNRVVERIRIPCQESGQIGAEDLGSCHIIALFGM